MHKYEERVGFPARCPEVRVHVHVHVGRNSYFLLQHRHRREDPFFRFSSSLFYVLKKVSDHSGRSKNLFIRDDFFHPRAIIKTDTAPLEAWGESQQESIVLAA